jgi:hypothetical protein
MYQSIVEELWMGGLRIVEVAYEKR